MKTRVLPVQVLLLWVLMCYSVKFAVSSTKNFDECLYRLRKAFVQEVLTDVGVDLFRQSIKTTKSFVYSDLQVVHDLVRLMAIGYTPADKSIKQFLSMKGYNCDDEYCGSFNDILRDINETMDNHLVYETIIYTDKNLQIREWSSECGAERKVDFRNLSDVKAQVNKEFQKFSGNARAQCIQKDLYEEDSFYLYNAFKLNPALLGDIKSYEYDHKFTDLDGNHHEVEWLGTTGSYWSVTTEILPFPYDDPPFSITCNVQVFRTEINRGRQYMLYFMPLLKEGALRKAKTKCLEEILYNLRIYVEQTIDKSLKPLIDYPPDFTTLLIPAMDIITENNLAQHFITLLQGLFWGKSITELYYYSTKLYDLRTCDRFYNKEKEHVKQPLSNVTYLGILAAPFVFTLVDKATNIFIKTGAYYGPGSV